MPQRNRLKRKRRPKVASYVAPRPFDLMYRWPLMGMDEVGTGGAAGPIAAGGVVLPQDQGILDLLESLSLRDSKQMSIGGRERVCEILRKHAPFCEVVYVYPRMLERLGQGPSLNWMFNELIGKFRVKYGTGGAILLDGDKRDLDFFHLGVRQGDQRSFTISAASVVAKVERDRLMVEFAEDFPGYGLAENKGYLTHEHRKGLNKHGVAEIHRRNVKPIQKALELKGERFPWAMA